MARVLLRKAPLSPEERNERSHRYRVFGHNSWNDPYPSVPGTKPEKMVYAELVARGYDFRYQEWLRVSIPDLILEADTWYKPDFIIPSRKIILEINGAYWHTKESRIEQDAFKYALFEMMGYRVIIWWDYEIDTHMIELFSREGLYHTGAKVKPPVRSDGKTTKDGAEAAALMGLKRRKPWTKKPVMIKSKKRKKRRYSYNVSA